MEQFTKNVEVENKYEEVFDVIKDRPINEQREVASMVADLRPVAEMQIDVTPENESKIKTQIENLRKYGLTVLIHELPVERNLKPVNLSIFKDPKLATEVEEVRKLWNIPVPPEFHRRFGKLMGLPDTSVVGIYKRKTVSKIKSLPIWGFQENTTKVRQLFLLAFPREHYPEKAKYLKKYFRSLIDRFPDTYVINFSPGEVLGKYKTEAEAFLDKDFYR